MSDSIEKYRKESRVFVDSLLCKDSHCEHFMGTSIACFVCEGKIYLTNCCGGACQQCEHVGSGSRGSSHLGPP